MKEQAAPRRKRKEAVVKEKPPMTFYLGKLETRSRTAAHGNNKHAQPAQTTKASARNQRGSIKNLTNSNIVLTPSHSASPNKPYIATSLLANGQQSQQHTGNTFESAARKRAANHSNSS